MSIEYFDMVIPEVYEQHKMLLEQVKDRFTLYPLVFVNGELELVGSTEYYEVLHVVSEALKQPVAS